MTQIRGMVWHRAHFLRIWAVLAFIWVAGVAILFYDDMTKANNASDTSTDRGGEASREAGSTPGAGRSVAQTAMVALLPPAGTLVTGLALGWFVSRPKRNTQA